MLYSKQLTVGESLVKRPGFGEQHAIDTKSFWQSRQNGYMQKSMPGRKQTFGIPSMMEMIEEIKLPIELPIFILGDLSTIVDEIELKL